MNLIKYIILGLIQGFTEPLPISSSGHLKIFRYLFKDNLINDLTLEIFLNFSSFLAVVFFYKKDIKELLFNSFKYIKTKETKYKKSYKYIILIIISTLFPGLIGLLLKDYIENIFDIKLVSICLLITSLLLFLIKDKDGYKKEISIKDSIIIGLFESISIFPGISRSASTLTGCLNQNIDINESIKYSFMLYLPISIGTFILSLNDIKLINNYYLISAIFTFISTYFSLKLFINIVKKKKLIYFSIYCLLIGLITFFI